MLATTGTPEDAALRLDALHALREVLDPEVGINVVELGLVTQLQARGGAVDVSITTTSPACPLGEVLVRDAEEAVRAVPGVGHVTVTLDRHTRWEPSRMTDAARAALGWSTP